MSDIIKGGQWRQYLVGIFLWVLSPGCLGAFMNVSLYVPRHDQLWGHDVGGMRCQASGDEAFVMLSQFPPGTALGLFLLLFVLGILFAWVSDKLVPVFRDLCPVNLVRISSVEESLPGQSNMRRKSGDIFRPANILENFRAFSFTRFLPLVLILSFPYALVVLTSGDSRTICMGMETDYFFVPFHMHPIHYITLL